METSPRDSTDMTLTHRAGIPLAPEAGTSPSEMPTPGTTDEVMPDAPPQHVIDRAKEIGKSGMGMIHDAGDRIHEIQDQHPMLETSKKTKMIAAGTIAAAGIGMMARKRQQSKSMPENIMGKMSEKAKDLLPSR